MFKKATKEKSKLRLAIFGPSGSGKTFSALSVAQGMGKKIALIDTERRTASKYADRFNFSVCDLEVPTIDKMVYTIKEARDFDILIIDSLSHSWQELIQEVNMIANAKFKGNSWSAWSEGTPKQKLLIKAILDFPGHIICTMRSKTEWITEKTEKGTSRPVRVGLAPIQGKDIEYEFDMLMELSTDHIAYILKDRTGKYQDEAIDKPNKKLGEELIAWLAEGKESYYIQMKKKFEKCKSGPQLASIKENLSIESNKAQLTGAELNELRRLYKELSDKFNSSEEKSNPLDPHLSLVEKQNEDASFDFGENVKKNKE